MAQRLVRTLCPHCREPYVAGAELSERLGLAALSDAAKPLLYRPVGCGDCRDTGYHGRTTIAEILPITEDMRQAILRKAGAGELHALARRAGMESMQIMAIARRWRD